MVRIGRCFRDCELRFFRITVQEQSLDWDRSLIGVGLGGRSLDWDWSLIGIVLGIGLNHVLSVIIVVRVLNWDWSPDHLVGIGHCYQYCGQDRSLFSGLVSSFVIRFWICLALSVGIVDWFWDRDWSTDLLVGNSHFFWGLFMYCFLGDGQSLDTICGIVHPVVLSGTVGTGLWFAVRGQSLVSDSVSGTLPWVQFITQVQLVSGIGIGLL